MLLSVKSFSLLVKSLHPVVLHVLVLSSGGLPGFAHEGELRPETAEPFFFVTSASDWVKFTSAHLFVAKLETALNLDFIHAAFLLGAVDVAGWFEDALHGVLVRAGHGLLALPLVSNFHHTVRLSLSVQRRRPLHVLTGHVLLRTRAHSEGEDFTAVVINLRFLVVAASVHVSLFGVKD